MEPMISTVIAEKSKWHLATWGVPALIGIIILIATLLATLAGYEMTVLLAIFIIGLSLAILVIWIAAYPKTWKIMASMTCIVVFGLAALWVFRNDRPILIPEMNDIAFPVGDSLGIDLAAYIRNAGRQSGYAQDWKLILLLDGSSVQGTELHGQALPSKAISGSEISDQEFAPGKPVRGWLFFYFPTLSEEYARKYFSCSSPLRNQVRFRLSVSDTKERVERSEEKSLSDFGNAACFVDASPQMQGPGSLGPTSTPREAARRTPLQKLPEPIKQPEKPVAVASAGGTTGSIIATGPCPVFQVGGVGNTASPQCLIGNSQIRYEPNGVLHTSTAGRFEVSDDKYAVFQSMTSLMSKGNWKELLNAANTEMQNTPEWGTPIYYAAKANLMLCDKEAALKDFNLFIAKTKESEDYTLSRKDATWIADEISKNKLPPQCSERR